ncbi:MAG TPA: MBL fold metallo-hydrolase [Candidatus Marinimicrobia bacterium]|nr:MBL fold metallo-hydrolase [Candidatus Neomarinimicrobiota bacterium]
MATITFLGATGTVTGSKYVLEHENTRIMIDCGLFQGLKELRLRNWQVLPYPISQLDAMVLTHAHIDHTGYLPRLVKQGFDKPVYCSAATADLLKVMLLDSAHLQVEDAKYLNKRKATKHSPARPLYDIEDAEKAIELLTPVSYNHTFKLGDFSIRLRDAGHILGSSFVIVKWNSQGQSRKISFSGDLGRPNRPILKDPSTLYESDYLLIESTYGNRLHNDGNPVELLKRIIHDTVQRRGVLLIPSFAVGRTQELIYILRELEEKGEIPVLPVFVDSPMAISATKIYADHIESQDLDARLLSVRGIEMFKTSKIRFTQSPAESKKINDVNEPSIIISASGMLTGGRILHHLVNRLPNPRNAVLFIGYQAEGTRGRALLSGRDKIKIHGQWIPAKAEIETISGFSAHADYEEILAWLTAIRPAPKMTYIVHGEAKAAANLQKLLGEKLNWQSVIPQYQQKFVLE